MRSAFKFLVIIFLINGNSLWAQDSVGINRKIHRVESILRSIKNRLPRMSYQQLEKQEQKINDVLSILKNGNRLLPRGGRPFLNTVSGSIEDISFIYEVTSAVDLAAQCVNEFDGKITNVDEVKVSANFQPLQKKTTSGWWKGAGKYCGEVAEIAVKQGLQSESTRTIMAVGSIEEISFTFAGNTLTEIMNQCIDFHAKSGISNVDELSVFNGIENITKTTSGWWRSSTEVCNMIIQQIK